MKCKIEECYKRLQKLEIVASVDNMEILLQTLYDLREIYNELNKGDDDGRASIGAE